jgi:hypothetical protein
MHKQHWLLPLWKRGPFAKKLPSADHAAKRRGRPDYTEPKASLLGERGVKRERNRVVRELSYLLGSSFRVREVGLRTSQHRAMLYDP